MPVYLSLSSLIIKKSVVEEKYSGGVKQFRSDYFNRQGSESQEDDELFLIARMNCDEFDLDEFISFGFDYDEVNEHSNDFVIHQRYNDFLWNVDWIDGNSLYAWHVNVIEALKVKANKFEELTMEAFVEICDKGQKPFIPLTLENINSHPIVVYFNSLNNSRDEG